MAIWLAYRKDGSLAEICACPIKTLSAVAKCYPSNGLSNCSLKRCQCRTVFVLDFVLNRRALGDAAMLSCGYSWSAPFTIGQHLDNRTAPSLQEDST